MIETALGIFATIEVWVRLRPSTAVGPQTFKNTRQLLRKVLRDSKSCERPLISTDGFVFYLPMIEKLFGRACVYGRVLKS